MRDGEEEHSAKAFETCRVAWRHGFCADDSCSLPISKCTRRRNELRSFRFQVRSCTVMSSHKYNLGCREVSRCRCREVRNEDNVRRHAMLFVTLLFGKCFCFVVLRCCKSDLRFRVGSFQRRAPWPCVQPCGWLRGRWFGFFRFFLWFCAVCPLGMRGCATTRTLRSSHNC